MTAQLRFALRAGGVCLALDASAGRLPAVLHWGADLGELDAAAFDGLAAATAPSIAPNEPDVPVRVALVPEVSTGWILTCTGLVTQAREHCGDVVGDGGFGVELLAAGDADGDLLQGA